MPILARLEGAARFPPVVIPVDDRRLEFRSVDGVEFIDWTGREWIIAPGIQGLAVPPREVVTQRVPGLEGSRLREVRTTERSVVLPFVIFADDGDYRTHSRQLARVRSFLDYRVTDYVSDEGTFDLVGVAGGSQRFLRCVYVDGMEGAGADGPGDFSTFDVKLTAVAPYWRGVEWSTPVVALPTPAPFLSNNAADAFPRAVTASVALGADMAVIVGGDVPSPPVVELSGPATSTRITSTQGLDVTIGAVTAGQTFILDTGRRRRALLNGAAAWGMVGDSPQWKPLPPGETTISVVVAGATTATRARVYGTSLWETPW